MVFPPERSSLWGCCRTWENELCMKTFPCYPLVVLMPQIMFLLREPNMRHGEKIILYISFKKIKKLQHNLFHFHPFPHCLSYIYPPSQSPPVSFGFNGGHSPVWNFSPQTNSNNRSAAISEACERKMILKCPEDLRFTSLDTRWKHPLFFWDWFWLVCLRMVPIMCKISAGSTGGKAFVYLTRSAFIWRHTQKKKLKNEPGVQIQRVVHAETRWDGLQRWTWVDDDEQMDSQFKGGIIKYCK